MILTDSRGENLQKDIRADFQKRYPHLQHGVNITVQVVGGARTDNIISKADRRYLKRQTFDMIYTFVGINDLTSKINGMVVPNFENVPELVDTLTDSLIKLKSDLSKRARKIVISQFVGIDLDRYNDYVDEGVWYYQQKMINDSMPILAHTINLINRDDNTTGPWITGTVHDYVNHKLYNRYAKLYDGLHPTECLRKKWAKLFTDSIVKNM